MPGNTVYYKKSLTAHGGVDVDIATSQLLEAQAAKDTVSAAVAERVKDYLGKRVAKGAAGQMFRMLEGNIFRTLGAFRTRAFAVIEHAGHKREDTLCPIALPLFHLTATEPKYYFIQPLRLNIGQGGGGCPRPLGWNPGPVDKVWKSIPHLLQALKSDTAVFLTVEYAGDLQEAVRASRYPPIASCSDGRENLAEMCPHVEAAVRAVWADVENVSENPTTATITDALVLLSKDGKPAHTERKGAVLDQTNERKARCVDDLLKEDSDEDFLSFDTGFSDAGTAEIKTNGRRCEEGKEPAARRGPDKRTRSSSQDRPGRRDVREISRGSSKRKRQRSRSASSAGPKHQRSGSGQRRTDSCGRASRDSPGRSGTKKTRSRSRSRLRKNAGAERRSRSRSRPKTKQESRRRSNSPHRAQTNDSGCTGQLKLPASPSLSHPRTFPPPTSPTARQAGPTAELTEPVKLSDTMLRPDSNNVQYTEATKARAQRLLRALDEALQKVTHSPVHLDEQQIQQMTGPTGRWNSARGFPRLTDLFGHQAIPSALNRIFDTHPLHQGALTSRAYRTKDLICCIHTREDETDLNLWELIKTHVNNKPPRCVLKGWKGTINTEGGNTTWSRLPEMTTSNAPEHKIMMLRRKAQLGDLI